MVSALEFRSVDRIADLMKMKKQTATRKSKKKNEKKLTIKAFILVEFKSLISTKFKRDISKKLAASDNN